MKSKIVFACYEKACAPPPTGKGGSSKGGTLTLGIIRGDIQRERKAILRELDAQGVSATNPLRHIFERRMGNNVLVVRSEGKMVGGVQFEVSKQFKELTVTDMRMLQERSGHGTRAFKHLARLAKDQNLSLGVTNAIESAKPFYAKQGAIFQKGFGSGRWTPAARDALASGKPVQGDTAMPYADWVKIDFE